MERHASHSLGGEITTRLRKGVGKNCTAAPMQWQISREDALRSLILDAAFLAVWMLYVVTKVRLVRSEGKAMGVRGGNNTREEVPGTVSTGE